MCWSHTYRNVWPKVARKENKELGESILSDIESIQWMCQTKYTMLTIGRILADCQRESQKKEHPPRETWV